MGSVKITVEGEDGKQLAAWRTDDDGTHHTLDTLTVRRIIEANRERCAKWHDQESEPWSGADWANAMGGEVGELWEAFMPMVALAVAAGKAGNTVKKLRREQTLAANAGDPPPAELRRNLSNELADVFFYGFLLADDYDIDVVEALVTKFNTVSEKQGFPDRLP